MPFGYSAGLPARGALCLFCGRGNFELERKASRQLPPRYIDKEQDATQGLSSQFAERAGNGLHAFSSSKELRGLSVRAQVRV